VRSDGGDVVKLMRLDNVQVHLQSFLKVRVFLYNIQFLVHYNKMV